MVSGGLVGVGMGMGGTYAALADEVEEHYSGAAAGVGALVVWGLLVIGYIGRFVGRHTCDPGQNVCDT